MNLADCQPGTVVKHYKGGLYDILGAARSSEARDRIFIIYASRLTEAVWVRPARRTDCRYDDEDAFCDNVDVDRDGTTITVERFTKVAGVQLDVNRAATIVNGLRPPNPN